MTESFTPLRWSDPEASLPLRTEAARQAIVLGFHLYNVGTLRRTRVRFAAELSRQPAVRERWLRSLALEIKR